MIDAVPTPDALLVPEALKSGVRQIDRINSVLEFAEPILNVDRTRGERAYIRRQPGGRLFITANPADTLLNPVGHPREGSERYRWSIRVDGVSLGYLRGDSTHGTA